MYQDSSPHTAADHTAATPGFTADVYQNEYLPEGGTDVNAIVTVTSTGGTGAHTSTAAVVIMVDCSGSMNYPPSKMEGARQGTAAAIDAIEDNVAFAVVAGTHRATEVYPGGGVLAIADHTTRSAAKAALRDLQANGGTAIGTWLTLADRLFESTPTDLRHGILLTDGRNEHESAADLQDALRRSSGRFTCDARGVGTDWEVQEVRAIATQLLGTADIIAEPEQLAADFTTMMETAMDKEVGDVTLRVWTPQGAEVAFLKQVAPVMEDLTGRRTENGTRTGDYPTGSWGDESRDYHISLKVPASEVGQEMLAGRVSLVARHGDGSEEVLSQGLIRAVWTDDMAASTRLSPQVAHYTGQAELSQTIQQGLELRKAGDEEGATMKLGRAVQLAHNSGNSDTARLLAKVVDVEDASSGTVRLKSDVSAADEMTLDTRSTKTVRVNR